MYSFASDYNELCCKEVLNKMNEYYGVQFPGYSMDELHFAAVEKIKKELQSENSDVHFLVGGTQANVTVLDHILLPYQGAIAATSGHINTHETGALEATGHKVIVSETVNGKICGASVEKVMAVHTDEHMVMPKAVYVSDSTEIGTIYTKADLEELRAVCDKYGLYLFLDGARLGCALTSEANDLTMADLARLTDVFYIGATKNGGLIGEAVVINNDELKPNFRYSIKQHGGLLAKGLVLSLQFDTLFTDGLFYKLATHANKCAKKMQDGLKALGVEMLADSPTNQIFPILPNELVAKLAENFEFNVWEKGEEKTCFRLVCSFNTDETYCDKLVEEVKELLGK